MLYTVVNTDYVLYGGTKNADNNKRSTNPYDYIRGGWFLDNSVMYRGVNNVNLNSDFSSHISGNNIHLSDK